MISNIDGFINSIFEIVESNSNSYLVNSIYSPNGNMYCPKCCGERRMSIKWLYSLDSMLQNGRFFITRDLVIENNLCTAEVKNKLISSFWTFTCLQCETLFTVAIYEGANGVEMAILPSCTGGVVTPNTPPSVAYYLDQAYRSKSVGANSACISMYRASLEQMLYEQGYKEGMLNKKIQDLEKSKNDVNAKKWVRELDIELLKYIKDLGNGSIHTNDGNVEKQGELDNQLINEIDIVFMALLDMVYEQPIREEERKNLFKSKTKVFEKAK